MPHGPARWPPYGRPETSRLLKVDHYMLHLRIMMCSGGCAASSQNDAADTGGGVVRSFDPGSVTRGTVCLTSVCVQGDLEAFIYGQVRAGSSRPRSSPTEAFEQALRRAVEHVAEGQENNRGTPQGCSRRGDEVTKISQSLNLVMAADLRRRSYRPPCATRTRSKFASTSVACVSKAKISSSLIGSTRRGNDT
jgi:hypothetical protein